MPPKAALRLHGALQTQGSASFFHYTLADRPRAEGRGIEQLEFAPSKRIPVWSAFGDRLRRNHTRRYIGYIGNTSNVAAALGNIFDGATSGTYAIATAILVSIYRASALDRLPGRLPHILRHDSHGGADRLDDARHEPDHRRLPFQWRMRSLCRGLWKLSAGHQSTARRCVASIIFRQATGSSAPTNPRVSPSRWLLRLAQQSPIWPNARHFRWFGLVLKPMCFIRSIAEWRASNWGSTRARDHWFCSRPIAQSAERCRLSVAGLGYARCHTAGATSGVRGGRVA